VERRIFILLPQLLVLVVLIIAALIAVGFVRQAQFGASLQAVHAQKQHEYDTVKTEHDRLLARRDGATSDDFAEHFARDEQKWAKAGDYVIVPVYAAPKSTPAPPSTSAPSPTPTPSPPIWHDWWRLFFDSDPPDFGTLQP
jgi:hypothetical protein